MRYFLVFCLAFSSLFANTHQTDWMLLKQHPEGLPPHVKHPRGCPEWANNQIEKDLAPFAIEGITLSAIETTLEKCILDSGQSNFTRYRIINNTIYRSNHEIWLNYFDRVLSHLANITTLPNVDFILSLHDGVVPYREDPRTGEMYWITENPQDQAPVFTRARIKNTPYLVLLPDYAAFWHATEHRNIVMQANKKYPWHQKSKKAFWRGHSSESPVFPNKEFSRFSNYPRVALSIASLLFPDKIDAGFVDRSPPSLSYHAPDLASQFPSFTLAKPHTPIAEHMAYAYLPCLDGIVCTYPGYYWRLLSNSVVFKADSEQELWFYCLLEPFVHYIPMQRDCSNILEVIDWADKHQDLCQEISCNARNLVQENLTEEDNYLYVFYTLEKYAKLQRFDLRFLEQETEKSSLWRKIR